MNEFSVTVADGKYTVEQEDDGHLIALRYGKPWRDCCGDGLILSLANELHEARLEIQSLKTSLWIEQKKLGYDV